LHQFILVIVENACLGADNPYGLQLHNITELKKNKKNITTIVTTRLQKSKSTEMGLDKLL
jgi:hypothetical protein